MAQISAAAAAKRKITERAKNAPPPSYKKPKVEEHEAGNQVSKEENLFHPKQQDAIDSVKKGRNVFITGQGGVGKSFVLKEIIQYFHGKFTSHQIGVVAPTGIAAIALPNGKTIHSFSGVGIPESRRDFGKAWGEKDLWYSLKVLIIDEISMLSGEFLDCLSAEVCKMRGTPENVPFGGIQLIFCGDFLQLPPIPRSIQDINSIKAVLGEKYNPSKMYFSRGFAFQSNVWKDANILVCHLQHIYRQNDADFQEALADVRFGNVSAKTEKFFRSCDRPLSKIEGIEATKLYATNVDVDMINMLKLNELSGKEISHTSEDSEHVWLDDESDWTYEQAKDFLRKSSFFESCIAQEHLTLKVNAQVMLIKNDHKRNLVNGSRGVVIGFANIKKKHIMPDEDLEKDDYDVLIYGYTSANPPVVRFLDGQVKVIRKEDFTERWEGIGFCIRKQIPLKLAWAITIHKSQGMSINYMSANLKKVFADGQAYVAISRATSKDGLELRGFSKKIIHADTRAFEFYRDPSKQFPHWDSPWNFIAEETMTDADNDTVREPPKPKPDALKNIKFVVTGEPLGISREDLELLIVNCGGQVTSAVSGKTNFLLVGQSGVFEDGRPLVDGNKYKKAKEIINGPNNKSKLNIISQKKLYDKIINFVQGKSLKDFFKCTRPSKKIDTKVGVRGIALPTTKPLKGKDNQPSAASATMNTDDMYDEDAAMKMALRLSMQDVV